MFDIAANSTRRMTKMATPRETTTLQGRIGSIACYGESISPAASSLAPKEPRAPISILTPAKRAALIACLSGGILEKQRGVWTPSSGGPCDKRISGITVADLGRDGMLSLTMLGRHASAQLTTRGSWFARTLVTETVAQDTAQQKHHGSAL
jgi:hypothetical protein